MGRPKSNPSETSRKRRPALTPEARERQMIAYATDLAEKQLIEGTASAQVITHFLKQGTAIAELEKEKLKKENALLEAKTKAIESAERVEQLYSEALRAMKLYRGDNDD